MNHLQWLALLLSMTVLVKAQAADPINAEATPSQYATAEDLGLMQGFPPPPEQRVDASNGIFGVPYNRWSYQHMRRIYPSAPVQPAKQPIHLKRGINADIETLLVKREDGSPSNLLAFLSETYTDAFVVLQEDTVVYERYLNGMTPDTPTR